MPTQMLHIKYIPMCRFADSVRRTHPHAHAHSHIRNIIKEMSN
jgi:hypothetical protein